MNTTKIPDSETRAKSVANLQKVCHQIDSLTSQLDDIIYRLEDGIQQNINHQILLKK